MRFRRFAGRLGQYALVLWVALTLNFALPHLAPGGPLDYLVDEAEMLSPEQREHLLSLYGLDRSTAEQYFSYWGQVARGDLGTSTRFNRPVTDLLADHLPWTLLLLGTGLAASTLLGGAAGAVAAHRRGSRTDIGLLVGVIALDALPGFLVALGLVAVFSVELGWLPSFGARALGGGPLELADIGRRLILPAAALTLATVGPPFLLVRGAMVSLAQSGFVRMAEAKGASPLRILFRHLLRNSLLPVTSNLAVRVGAALGGAMVIETVFAYPGVGRLVYEAVLARDYPLLRGAFLLSVVGVIAANLLADLLYPQLDPRVRPATATAP